MNARAPSPAAPCWAGHRRRPTRWRRSGANRGPQSAVLLAATPLPLAKYIASVGDEASVINMLEGDTQRIEIYAERRFAIPQPMPDDVRVAMALLVNEGYTQRLV